MRAHRRHEGEFGRREGSSKSLAFQHKTDPSFLGANDDRQSDGHSSENQGFTSLSKAVYTRVLVG